MFHSDDFCESGFDHRLNAIPEYIIAFHDALVRVESPVLEFVVREEVFGVGEGRNPLPVDELSARRSEISIVKIEVVNSRPYLCVPAHVVSGDDS
jgi:hypothetical protein